MKQPIDLKSARRQEAAEEENPSHGIDPESKEPHIWKWKE